MAINAAEVVDATLEAGRRGGPIGVRSSGVLPRQVTLRQNAS